MPKLYILTGLPGSGKTFLASKMIEEAKVDGKVLVRVNKDDIRRRLEANGWVWSHENEKKDVIPVRDQLITYALASGTSVISDDTNFGKHRAYLTDLVKPITRDVEVIALTTPIEVCIERDSQRTGKAKVGVDVITSMALKYCPEAIKPSQGFVTMADRVDPKTGDPLMPALICDLDGTLSLFQEKDHRNPYDASRCDEDDLNPVVHSIITLFHRSKLYQVIYLSGRFERFRPQTMKFLEKHGCPIGPLYMRPDNDHRKDSIIKRELFDKHVRSKWDVRFVLDDRSQVIKMWRHELGLTCLQVADGDF